MSSLTPVDLASIVVKAAEGRAGVDPSEMNDIIMGHNFPNGETPSVARLAALKAGFPVEVPGLVVERQCASGVQASHYQCLDGHPRRTC